MKVLVCIPCLLTGGTEIQTLSLVEALVDAGHKVCVACYFEYAESMVERYRNAGAEIVLFATDRTRPSGVLNTARLLWKSFRSIVKSFRPDVAHIQYMNPGALPVLILKMLGVRKLIATTHTDADIYSRNSRIIIRILLRTCLTAFQCITERAEKSYFGSSKLFDGKLSRHFTIYNNIPSHISILVNPRPVKADTDSIIVGVVSRLEHIKGMDLVVPAYAKAYRQNHRLKLLVVGDGSQRQLMEQQVAQEGLNDAVEFAGRQPQSELQSYYDRIDILLMPSRSEGFGLTAIEGMARGCVPLVSKVGGLQEVVTTDCGQLHERENMGQMSEMIVSMANDSNLDSLSQASIKRASTFSSSNYYQKISKLYKLLSECF